MFSGWDYFSKYFEMQASFLSFLTERTQKKCEKFKLLIVNFHSVLNISNMLWSYYCMCVCVCGGGGVILFKGGENLKKNVLMINIIFFWNISKIFFRTIAYLAFSQISRTSCFDFFQVLVQTASQFSTIFLFSISSKSAL